MVGKMATFPLARVEFSLRRLEGVSVGRVTELVRYSVYRALRLLCLVLTQRDNSLPVFRAIFDKKSPTSAKVAPKVESKVLAGPAPTLEIASTPAVYTVLHDNKTSAQRN